MRLIEDGRFGSHLMRLMVAQNAPFLPIYNAWWAQSREILPYDEVQARHDAGTIRAKVLSNRKPPYSIAGGLYDALKATNGNLFYATNEEVERASELFLRTEGIDIDAAAGVALAALCKAVKAEQIERDAVVMLNITGGGAMRYRAKNEIFHLEPSHIFATKYDKSDLLAKIERLFR